MEDELIIDDPQVAEQEFQEPPEKRRALYDKLYKSQLYTKSYDEFKKKYSTPESLEPIYQNLSDNQWYTKSKEEFINQYFDVPKTDTGNIISNIKSVQNKTQPDANVSLGPKTQYKPEISSPDFKPQAVSGTRDFSFEKTPDERDAGILDATARKAHDRIIDRLHSDDPQYEKLIRQDRANSYTMEQMKADYAKTGQIIPIGKEKQWLEREKKRQYDLPVTPQDISDAKTGTILNEQGARNFIHNSGDKKLQADAYIVNARNSISNDPNGISRINKVLKNKEKIEKGHLQYDASSDMLLKPESFLSSLVTASIEKGRLFDSYEYYTDNDKAAVVTKLENDMRRHDPDEPIPIPEGSGHAGAFIGGMPVAGLVAGGIAGAGATLLGAPEAAPLAQQLTAGAISSVDMYKMGYASALEQSYRHFRQQGFSENDSYNKANELAHSQAAVDAVSGGAMGALSFGKIFTPAGSITKAFGQSLVKGLKQVGETGLAKGAEGLTVGGFGAAGQIVKNIQAQQAGMPIETYQGVGEQLGTGVYYTLAAALMAKFSKSLTGPTKEGLKQGLSKMPEEQLNQEMNNLVQTGQVSEHEAKLTIEEIQKYKEIDQTIPENVSAENRQKIHDKIKQRNEIESKIETTDKALHEPLKEKVKKLNEEIVQLASEKEQKSEDAKLVDKLIERGKIDEAFQGSSKENPEALIKYIAEKSYGEEEKGIREAFGDDIVDKARELYPLNKNIEQNAIPIESADALHVRETPGDSGQMEPGISESKESTGTQEGIGQEQASKAPGQEKVGEYPGASDLPFGEDIGIAHDYRKIRASETGQPMPERGEVLTPEQYVERGRQLIRDGVDPQKVADDFKQHGKIGEDDISVVRAEYERLARATNKAADEFGVGSKEDIAAREAESKWYNEVVKPMQTVWAAAGREQQGVTDIDTGSFTGIRRAFTEETGREMSEQQAKEAKAMSSKVASLTKEVDALKEKLTEALKNQKQSGKPPKTIKEKAEQFADLIRKGKASRPDTFSAASPASLVWDAALEIMAKTVEAGGTVVQAIADGLAHIKESDWYKGLDDEGKAKAEGSFSDYFKSEDIFTKYVEKKDDKFGPDEATEIWNYAKTNYLDKGKDFSEMVSGVAKDLGLKVSQVVNALASDKATKKITDEMYKKQYQQRNAIQQAKHWVKAANTPKLVKALKFIPHLFFRLKTFGHGTVGGITHAGMNIFMPSAWKQYWPSFFKQFKFAFGKTADYEKAMVDLQTDPDFIFWKRAGLAVDPATKYDDYQTFDKLLGRLGAAGDRGFNALKIMRLEMAKQEYNRLSDAEKADPNTVKEIAQIINHATGSAKVIMPEAAGTLFFAPRLEYSRWARLIVQPAKAIKTISNWKNASAADKAAAKIVARRSGEVIATYMAALAANQGLLMLTGSKQSVNFTHPTDPDWLRFKMGDKTVDVTGGMVSALSFLTKLVHIATESRKELGQKQRTGEFAKSLGGYARGKLSPFAGTVADVATHHDYGGNTLPYSHDKPLYPGSHKLTWKEYLLHQQTPIPVAEAIKDATEQMRERGMSQADIKVIMDAIIVGAASGGTGARVMPEIKK